MTNYRLDSDQIFAPAYQIFPFVPEGHISGIRIHRAGNLFAQMCECFYSYSAQFRKVEMDFINLGNGSDGYLLKEIATLLLKRFLWLCLLLFQLASAPILYCLPLLHLLNFLLLLLIENFISKRNKQKISNGSYFSRVEEFFYYNFCSVLQFS